MTSLDRSPAPTMTGSSLLFTHETSVSEAIAVALEDAGIDLVMGLCAGHTTPLFEALYRHPAIRTIQVRQELLGALAANAYGKLTSRPAVISGEGEFILGTGTQGIIESLLGSSPMVILTEMFDGGRMSHHGNYHSGAGEHGVYDAVAAFKAICKIGVRQPLPGPGHPADPAGHQARARREPRAGRGDLSLRLLRGQRGTRFLPAHLPRRPVRQGTGHVGDPSAIADAAEAIGQAQRPVIIAGNGVRMSQGLRQPAGLRPRCRRAGGHYSGRQGNIPRG